MPFEVPFEPRMYESVARMLCTDRPLPPAYFELQARLRREVLREQVEGLRADHLRQHEDGEDEAVRDLMVCAALLRGTETKWKEEEEKKKKRR